MTQPKSCPVSCGGKQNTAAKCLATLARRPLSQAETIDVEDLEETCTGIKEEIPQGNPEEIRGWILDGFFEVIYVEITVGIEEETCGLIIKGTFEGILDGTA